jgi:hypothetical protein
MGTKCQCYPGGSNTGGCPAGQFRQGTACVPGVPNTGSQQCPFNMFWNPVSNNCVADCTTATCSNQI